MGPVTDVPPLDRGSPETNRGPAVANPRIRDAMGRAARARHDLRYRTDGVSHAAGERLEPMPPHPGAGQHPDRGRRAEPGELAGRRDRTGRRAPAPEEDRGRRGGTAPAAAPLDGR